MSDELPEEQVSIRAVEVPSMDCAAFVCPHCSAHTQQRWYKMYADPQKVGEFPRTPDEASLKTILNEVKEPDQKKGMEEYIEKMLSFLPSFDRSSQGAYVYHRLVNMYLSRCFICDGSAVWLRDRMIWPSIVFEVKPNADLPDHIKLDFVEAATIASVSPRGAAALLRLAIEKLCLHLGKTGTIDAMIGELVTDGLNIRVKQALDVVRVTGNDAVHPGTISFGDDPSTVTTLFKMVNLIAEKMISEPKHVEEAFQSLPPEKRQWIEDRDRGALRRREKSDAEDGGDAAGPQSGEIRPA